MKKYFDAKRKPAHKYKTHDLVLWSGATKSDKDISRYEITALKGLKGYRKYKAVVAAEQLRPYVKGISDSDESDSEVNSTDELIDLLEG
ncbi:unnamed protein product [Acanthoscelides obtectus]|nr:unnamed protein product [Acanthoscelides obtectus]CAK1627011.1 hypothetical protein AOBTE_LOCUS4219 [Acanthoscelides obtectus]